MNYVTYHQSCITLREVRFIDLLILLFTSDSMSGNQNQRTFLRKTQGFKNFPALLIYLIICFDQSHGEVMSPLIACTP